MLQTILVYSFLIFLMLLFAYIAKQRKNWAFILIPIIVFSIIFGFRYKVGVDYFAYLNLYQYPANIPEKIEPGFSYLIKKMNEANLHYFFFFFFIAFWQMFLIFLTFKKSLSVYPFLAFTIMFSCVWLSFANGMRQELAFCLFVFSLGFLYSRRIVLHYTCLVLAASMHKSSVLLIPLYFIFRKCEKIIIGVKVQYILLAFAIILMSYDILSLLLDRFAGVLEFIDYSEYTKESYAEKIYNDVNIGLGFFINMLIDILLIKHCKSTEEKRDTQMFPIIYNLYFFGVILHYAFLKSSLIGRVNYYFYGFNFIIGAFTLKCLKDMKHRDFYLLIALYILTFVASMYRMETNTALFIFNWQEDLFYLKK